MQISEFENGSGADAMETDAAPAAGGIAGTLIQKMELLISRVEQLIPAANVDNTKKLKDVSTLLNPYKSLLSEEQRLLLWKLSYRLWNGCVDMANAGHAQTNKDSNYIEQQQHIFLRHIASDMLLTAGKIDGIPCAFLKTATFFHKTGNLYHKIRKFESAVACFEKAAELISSEKDASASEEYRKSSFELLLSRAKTAWETSQRTLTCTYLGRAKGLLSGSSERIRELAEQYLCYGRAALASSEDGQGLEAVMLMNQAFEVCSEALAKRIAKNSEEKCALEAVRIKALRYLSAGHLQGEDFQNVLKCVAVLKTESDHPTTPYLAMKAYIGLGLRNEAERELMQLAGHAAAPVDICLSAVESFLQSGFGGLDTARNAFYQMLKRFPRNKDLPLRVLEKILANLSSADQSCAAKVALATQITSDEVIIKLFADETGNERKCLHALLWNSASELFRAKSYELSITLFEGSMLYIPLDIEHSMRRAKSLRVLCLCYLALSLYDRADEYIREAEKIEPNVTCAFLKYKIRLQMKNEEEATAVLCTMLHCSDFDPDYLTLATHEAIACKAIVVATAAMSNLLKLYNSGKQISTKEVVVIRNMTLLHMENCDSLPDVLRFLNLAKQRLCEAGKDYFGSGITAQKELHWFAGSAWNSGLKAAKSNNMELCAGFFDCASEFYGALEDSNENLKMLLKSLILSVAAFLCTDRKHDSMVKEMLDRLEKAKQVQATLENQQEKVDEGLQLQIMLLNFEVRGQMGEHKAQLQIIDQSITMKECNPGFLLKMALSACEGKHRSLEVATAALKACLNMVLSSPNPEYKLVSLAIRKMIWIEDAKGEEEAAAEVYRQAQHIIHGTRTGEYPVEEAKWLVSTAWNRAGVHVRFNRITEAKLWMKLGLELVQQVPSMNSLYMSSMSQSLAQLEHGTSQNPHVNG